MSEQRDLFGARIGEYEVPANGAIATCRSCGAVMVWTKTHKGRAMPLSVATVEERDGTRYALAHFVDCLDAKKWSGHGG